MRSQKTKIALAAAILTALVGSAPASAQHGLHRPALAKGHQLWQPIANDALAKQNCSFGCGPLPSPGSGYQGDPWRHWGSYYGPMVGIP
jgi:hypothetical protein